jgi:hypothetical protein
MKAPEEIIREMREAALVLRDEWDPEAYQIYGWADALEAAVQEQDAKVERLHSDLETAERALDAQTDFRKEIERLQEALFFWLPSVSEDGTDRDERAARDRYLLAGYKGDLTDTAESRGWLETGESN